MNRRRFLHQLESVSTGIALGTIGIGLTGCGGFPYVQGTVVDNRVHVPVDTVGANRFALVDVAGLEFPIYVYRHSEARYTAVSTRCMHRGCQVDPEAEHLVCPCHGSEYDNDGAVLKGPTRDPLRRFPIRRVGLTLVIDLNPQVEER